MVWMPKAPPMPTSTAPDSRASRSRKTAVSRRPGCAEARPPSTVAPGLRSPIAATSASASVLNGSAKSSQIRAFVDSMRLSAAAASRWAPIASVVMVAPGRLSASSEIAGWSSASWPGPITPIPLAPTSRRARVPERSRLSTSP